MRASYFTLFAIATLSLNFTAGAGPVPTAKYTYTTVDADGLSIRYLLVYLVSQ